MNRSLLLPALAVSLFLAGGLTPPVAHAQETSVSDSTVQEKQEAPRRWGAGVQLSPLFGLSVRYAVTERFTVQVAGLPLPIGNDRSAGVRLLFKLYAQPSYNFYVSGGASALWGAEERSSPFLEESGRDNTYFVFSTLGGEYRFAERLGLGGGLGLAYVVQRSPILNRNRVGPLLDLGLHYYF